MMTNKKDLLALEHYLYCKNTDPCVILCRYKQIPLDDADKYLDGCIGNLVQAKEYKTIISAIKQATQNTCRRNDEAMFVLAYCVKKVNNDEFKALIYAALPQLIATQEDLFTFIEDYYRFNGSKAGIGRGLKKGLTLWYGKHTALELAEIFGSHRGLHKWQHKDLLHLIHIKCEDPDKKQLFSAVFQRGCKLIEKQDLIDETELMERPPGISRFTTICRLKICDLAKDAAEMIKLLNLKFDLVPVHLQQSTEVWEALLPQLSYQSLLEVMMKLNDLRLLKASEPFAKKFSLAVGNLQNVSGSKIHPITIYIVMRLYEQKKRYTETVKESHHAKKVERFHIEPNPIITKKLHLALNHSFAHHPLVGLRYNITIDLRKGMFFRKTYNSTHVFCMQATLLIALSLLKREKDVTINTFTADGTLEKVQLDKTMTWESAFEHLNQHKKEKTKINLKTPLVLAKQRKQKVDVFITIVDSLGRTSKEPPTQELMDYRKECAQPFAKYIIVNLARNAQDLNFEDKSFEGFLEITGFTEDVPKYIAAFAKKIIN